MLTIFSIGHDSCVELLMEQDNRRKLIGNSFSPIHCAVYVFPYKVVFTLLDTEIEAETDKIWQVWNSVEAFMLLRD